MLLKAGIMKSSFQIANSIGAFFSMNANLNSLIEKAYFISPVVNMEKTDLRYDELGKCN